MLTRAALHKYTCLIFAISILAAGVLAQDREVPFDAPIDPQLYLLRPGEELTVTLVGSKIEPLKITLNPEGDFIDQSLGRVPLAGLTLERAREVLGEALRRLYNVIDILISPSGPMPVTVQVVGAVANPGRYRLHNSQRVSDLVSAAGGLLPEASRRRLELVANDRVLPVDLDRAVYSGDITFDPCLYAGNLVRVPLRSGDRVQVIGAVAEPREVELLAGDDLDRVLLLCGGLLPDADPESLTIHDRGLNRLLSAPAADAVITVPYRELSSEERAIGVFGEVDRNRLLAWRDGITLSMALDSAGGPTDWANLGMITIFRRPQQGGPFQFTRQRYPVNGMHSERDGLMATPLLPGDSVVVPPRVGFVSVEGAVARPGRFPFRNEATIAAYLTMAGGLLPSVESYTIRIQSSISHVAYEADPEMQVFDGATISVEPHAEARQ